MHIRRVVIENIKSFGTLNLDLVPDGRNFPGWTVDTGDNGSGKTAFLRAVALALLGPDQSRGLVPDVSGWVSIGEASGSISVEIKPDPYIDKTERGGAQYKDTFWAEVEIADSNGFWELSSTDI